MKKRINSKFFIKVAKEISFCNKFSCIELGFQVMNYYKTYYDSPICLAYRNFYHNLFDFGDKIEDEGFNIYNIDDCEQIAEDDFQNFRVMLLLFAAEYIKTEKPTIEV